MIAYEHPDRVTSAAACAAEAHRLNRSLGTAVNRGDAKSAKYLRRRIAAIEGIARRYRRHDDDSNENEHHFH